MHLHIESRTQFYLSFIGLLLCTLTLTIQCKAAKQGDNAIIIKKCNGIMLVPVNINGIKVHLILDTGSTATILTPHFAKELRIELKPISINSEPNAKSGLVKRIEIGKWLYEEITTLVVPVSAINVLSLASEHKIGGILGMDLLGQLALGIDLKANTIRFWTEDTLKSETGTLWMKGKRTCIMSLREEPRTFQRFVPAQLGDKQTEFLFDTGAATCFVTKDLRKLLTPILSRSVPAASFSSLAIAERNIMPQISVGSYRFVYPSVLAISAGNTPNGFNDNVLGMEPFQNQRIFVNFIHNLLYLNEQIDADDIEYQLRKKGLVLHPGEKDNPMLVIPNSPASKWGIQSGDEFVRMDANSITQQIEIHYLSGKNKEKKKVVVCYP